MQFIRIHRRAGVTVAIALAAIALCASASSARVPGGPLHQSGQTGLAVPPIQTAQLSEPSAVEAQAALARSYRVKTIARYGNPELNAHPEATPTAAVAASKTAASSESFDWGDAAIGAATAMAIVLLFSAGTVVVRRRTQFGGA
jgi:hypothetical protein